MNIISFLSSRTVRALVVTSACVFAKQDSSDENEEPLIWLII